MTNRTDGLDAAGVADVAMQTLAAIALAKHRGSAGEITSDDFACAAHGSLLWRAWVEAGIVLAASRSALVDAPAGERVKALEWQNIDGDVVARTDVKSYCCRRFGDGFDLLIDGHHTKPYVHGVRETHPTLDAAKAAAQLDFATRVCSALASPTPSVAALQAENERLRKALQKLANEVGGLIAFEPEVRQAIGNTNWSVLQQRLAEADTLLTAARALAGEHP